MPFSNSILSRLQYQHETIAELITRVSEEELRHQINPGKWSAFEQIAHLASYQPTFIERMHKIVAGNDPFFERYVAENDPLFYAYLKKSTPELVAQINADRKSIFIFFQTLHDDDSKKTGNHPKYGKLDLSQWAHFFLLHEAHHLWVILQLVYKTSSETKK
jgi:hypothetical protein